MSEDSFEPVPASGLGFESFDQPSLFFLTHQDTIKHWARLESAAAEATQQWLTTTVSEDIANIGSGLDLELSAVMGPNHWRHLLLHPPEVPIVGGHPIIGLGLGWHSRKVNPMSDRPFVGIRVGTNPQGAAARTAFLDAGGRQVRIEEHLSGKGDATWPAYFNLPAADDHWWHHLDQYRSLIGAQLRLGIERFEAPMRAAIRASMVS